MKKLVHTSDGIYAFPWYWQTPAQTEKAAFEEVSAQGTGLRFEYVGLPWATIIDGLRGRSAMAFEILIAMHQLPSRCAEQRISVAQHIHSLDFVELYLAAGVTDLLWSHATHLVTEVQGIRIHPFPLYPAQTSDQVPPVIPATERVWLANFIGAYSPGLYLTNVRQHIFEDAELFPDLCIIKREAWHFERAVYQEQVAGTRPQQNQLSIEARHREEYLNAIRQSWFTLCPSGSGPNSIRVFESLCLGSIPIVLTRALRLPGDQALWEQAALIEEDSPQGYRRALEQARGMSIAHRCRMLEAGRRLYSLVTPTAYGQLITSIVRK